MVGMKQTIGLGVALLMLLTATAPAATLETWESSALQATFDGTADQVWMGDVASFAIEAGSWPDGNNIFGSNITRAIRSANASMTVAGQYTVVTDVAAQIDPTQLIEWSVYASGNSISIQTGYWFQMVVLANTSSAATIESPNAAFAGYRLTITQRTVASVSSDYLTLWKCSTSDSGWIALGQADLGSAWMNSGWNLKVTRSPAGLWTVSHATGSKGLSPTVDFTVTDTSVDLTGSTWTSGMTWITKGTSHANKFGFDDLRVEASEPPNVPPTADAGADQIVTDVDVDGSEIVTVSGGGSTDVDGTITGYDWVETGATIATSVSPDVLMTVGVHVIDLTVTDDDGAADTDSVIVTVLPGGPWPPVADAGPDQTVRDSDGSGSETVALDGTGSSDIGGSIVAHLWKENDAVITVGASTTAALAVGVHTLTLEVVDDESLTGTDTVQITVNAVGPTTDQISQYGITWTFSEPVEYGQFVTGDYWVIGPVTIVSTTPAPAGGKHGSMLNPSIGDGQAYDSGSGAYNAGAGVTFPTTLTGDNSLVTARSWTDTAEIHVDYTGHNISASTCNLRDAAVLTVLTDVPAADAFRPPYADTEKRIFRASDIRYDLLPRLAPPNTSPSYNYHDAGILSRSPTQTVAEQYGRLYARPWLLHVTDWSGRGSHPTENMPGYHREVYNCISVGASLLLMDLPDMDNLLIPFVQLGIDSYGVIATGAGDTSSDADSSINKYPVLLAGIMLDDAAMATNNYRFRTRWMTYYVVDGTSPYASAIVPYGQTYNGYPVAWRQDPGTQEHEHLDPATEWVLVSDGGGSKRESYRYINSHTWPGFALAARMMGAVDLWNDAAFFDYVDRWMTEAPTQYGTQSVGATSSAFVSAMWATYRNTDLPGDFDGSGDVNAADIDLLAAAIGSPSPEAKFDLTGDGTVDEADLDRMIHVICATEFGDATLDGAVDLDDFVLLKQNFAQSGGWANGDFNADGQVNLDDFVLLKQNFGFTSGP